MKMKILIMLFFLGFGGAAQEMILDIDEFREAEVDSGLKVNFSQAAENKAVITGNSRGEVHLYTRAGKLFVSSRLPKLGNNVGTEITIYYKELQNLNARQNSEVVLSGTIKQPYMSIEANEGALVVANLDVDELNTQVITGGMVKISGKALAQQIEVRSKGTFRGEDLPGERVNVIIKGGGNAHVNSNALVNATVEAGGDIFIYGNPEQVIKNSGIGATIQKIN